MVFVLGDEINQEIRTAFQKDTSLAPSQEKEVKNQFREHKKLMIKHLNRKWDVSFLDTYIQHKIIPKGFTWQSGPGVAPS